MYYIYIFRRLHRLLHAIGEPFVPWASGIESKFNSKKVEGKQLGQTLNTLRKGSKRVEWYSNARRILAIGEMGTVWKGRMGSHCCSGHGAQVSQVVAALEKNLIYVLFEQTRQIFNHRFSVEVGLLDAERNFQRQDTRKHLGAVLALSVTVVGRAIHAAMPAPVGDPRNLQGMMPQESLVEVVFFESLRWEWGNWWHLPWEVHWMLKDVTSESNPFRPGSKTDLMSSSGFRGDKLYMFMWQSDASSVCVS